MNYNFKSSEESKKQLGEHTLFGSIQVYTINPLPDNVNLGAVLQSVEEKIPKIFFHNVDSVYIGQFEEFEEKQVNAFYSDGGLFITNNQDDDKDMLDDIVHETAHAVEETAFEQIYDRLLEREFLSKRERLFYRLKDDYKVKITSFLDLDYSDEFDEFLYAEVGYPKLASLSSDLFNSPYAATSLQEYWANGFEEYFIGDHQRIKALSPILFDRITTLSVQYK